MTLEQSGLSAVRAAGTGDMNQLQTALDARAAAITLTSDTPPTPELHARLTTAIEIGDAIRGGIRSLKQRITVESTRLNQIRTYSKHHP
jgi:hypothetical protein